MDEKRGIRLSIRQVLMVTLLGYCGYTTLHADFPIEAFATWEWVWKALIFAIFLPLTLRTKLRIEALVLTMVLCASSIIKIGRASCRERVCQYVKIQVVAGSLKKKTKNT